jgi:hypothetical protein
VIRERPPCLCCYGAGPAGPKFDPAALGMDEDGYVDLFQREGKGPCAWVHYSCLLNFIGQHATGAPTAIKPDTICMICEVDVRAAELVPFYAGERTRPVAWVHAECIADY